MISKASVPMDFLTMAGPFTKVLCTPI